ncbi:RNA recognition motif domain-containing protein [Baaleninema sp.]|uniref:RNA recognition motif domain-containing protein n=1 Tax=Baaleninema sp. TaxID=3101197 RepID=UPI003D07662D
MSIRLYVGNLPKDVERQELQDFFQDAGEMLSVKVITDRKTGKCRGFGFVTVKNDEQADSIIEAYNGKEFKDSEIKIEKALPRKKGKEGSEAAASSSSGGGGKSSRRSNRSRGGSSSSDSGSAQPDPRWADELAKLKQMLATQTSNS